MLRCALRGSWLATWLILTGCATEVETKVPADGGEDDSLLRAAAGAADSAEQPTFMGDIGSGETLEGALSGDARYLAWTFDAARGQRIDLAARGAEPASLDTVLLLYASTPDGAVRGPLIAMNDDFAGTLSSFLSIGAPATGKYVAIVRRFDFGATGTVTLDLTLSGAELVCAAVYDPVCAADGRTYSNRCEAQRAGVAVRRSGECGGSCDGGYTDDTFEQARTEPGARLTVPGFPREMTLCAGDEDWYFVELLPGDGVAVVAQGAVHVDVYDASGVQTSHGYESNGQVTATAHAPHEAPGVDRYRAPRPLFFFRVHGDGASSVVYRLSAASII